MAEEISLEQLAASAKVTHKKDNNPIPTKKEEPKEQVQAPVENKPTPEENKQQQKFGPKMGGAAFNKDKASTMNASQMQDKLIAAGKMEKKQEAIEDAPVVKDAFEGMVRVIEERKHNMDNMLEVMKANAEEDALDAELNGGVPVNTPAESVNVQQYTNVPRPVNNKPAASQEEDDFAELNDDDDTQQTKPSVNVNQNVSVSKPVEYDMSMYNVDGNENEPEKDEPAKPKKPVIEPERPVEEIKPEPVVSSPASSQDKEESDLDSLLKSIDDDSEVIDNEDETQEEIIEKFKKSFENVKINQDQIDFRKFTIKSKPVSSSFILNNVQNARTIKRADWALYHTKRALTFSECTGPELEALRRTMENSNDVNRVIASLRFIYDHVIDANKPAFEAWTKLIRTEDIDSMYYGIYRACYSDSNLIARTCTADGCHKTSFIETDIDKMVVYGRPGDDPEKIKKEFNDIFNRDTTTNNEYFKSTLMQISNDLAVAYSPATLYSTFVVYATLRNDITQRYSNDLSTMSYIDNFFYIDRETSSLVPVEIKEYPGNLNKSVLNKLKVYHNILKGLTNDQYNVFMGKLNAIVEQPRISYTLPACKCPECDAEIPAQPIESMLQLLFTRAQLARIWSL